MKTVVLIFAIAISLTTGQKMKIIPPGPNNNGTTTVTPITTTSVKPTTTTPPKTTVAPNTTTTSTTTLAPNTTTTPITTLAPNTTTTSTTTLAPNTTTTPITTLAPNTTTSATTTTKPTPAPIPVNPDEGKWIVNYTNTNVTCIVLQLAIQIDLPYKLNNKSMNLAINVPKNASSIGYCIGNQTKQTIQLQWYLTNDNNTLNNITFNFDKITNTSKYDLKSIDVNVNVTFPGTKDSVILNLSHEKEEFQIPVNKSYKCLHEQKLNLTRSDNKNDNTTYWLHISHAQIQAFRHSTNNNFDEAFDCLSNETPDVVPIAVGCALAALVIIVLITYLIGRRRSQALGYMSMFYETNKKDEDYIPMKNLSCFK